MTSEPGFLLIKIGFTELLWSFCEINDPLNQANYLHYNVCNSTGWNTASKTDNKHDDTCIVVTKDKFMNT
ncbi:MAG: hypothetical protein RLZZ216_771 [Cyanobacteriota bacterium]